MEPHASCWPTILVGQLVAGKILGRKAKNILKYGSFVKDVILLSGPDDNKVPRQGARVWLMGNCHVVSGAHFSEGMG